METPLFYRYKHSDPPGPNFYQVPGYFSILPVRVGRYNEAVDRESNEIRATWSQIMGDKGRFDQILGCSTGLGNLVDWAYPEARPDRIQTGVRANEHGLWWDTLAEVADVETHQQLSKDLKDTLKTVIETGQIVKPKFPATECALSIFENHIGGDDDGFIGMAKGWLRYVEAQAKNTHNDMTFEAMLAHRVQDYAVVWAFELGAWMMGNDSSKEERASVHHIVVQYLRGSMLVNDYYSFNKEFQESKESGNLDRLQNSISTLMREYSYTEDEARQIIRKIVVEEEQAGLDAYEEWKKNPVPNAERIEGYIIMAMHMMGGTNHWASLAPRYHKPLSTNANDRAELIGKAHNGRLILEGYNPPAASANGSASLIPRSIVSKYHHAPMGSGMNGASVHKKKAPRAKFSRRFRSCDRTTAQAPHQYTSSLPSQNLRDKLIDSFNMWSNLSKSSLVVIKKVVDLLHNSSLMLDDIEDHSDIRRGLPATHLLYGQSQTINSANFVYACSFSEVLKLRKETCNDIFVEELENLHMGQSLDLHWGYHGSCPSIDEYITMVDSKTGGLFRLAVRLMEAESSASSNPELIHFATLLGRYYQILDDYKNLTSEEYSKTKTPLEDLSEAKLSLLLIHTLTHSPHVDRVRGALFHRRPAASGGPQELSMEMKTYVLGIMREAGSLEYAKGVLEELFTEIERVLGELEGKLGKNPKLRGLLSKLAV
ncbi:MAG: Geranylgeranyl pyrophosphate synthase [Vezdaea aestivalis]|nr:MAG: Geranylgeranyl pyrophosphate synthase [Vezdaea aestivalis]